MPTLMSAIVAFVAPKTWKVVALVTWTVVVVPPNCLIVIVLAVVAVTCPKTRGRTTLIALIVYEPSVAFDFAEGDLVADLEIPRRRSWRLPG